jgi:DNA-binding response OmpR family regulator
MPQSTDKPATVLVIEDSREVLAVLERILSANGYNVRTARDGDAGLAMALDTNPELVILDIGLPTVSGLQVAVELRNRSFRSPVLMLTARDSVSDKVTGLESGADDYLAKPFDYDELLARVKALLRRSTLRAGEAVMRVADLTLDPISREVTRNGRSISLTPKEYALLEYLMKNAGRELSREQITEQVWKQDYDPSTNIVDVYVNYLRKKIEDGDQKPLLHTVRGIGYVLRA